LPATAGLVEVDVFPKGALAVFEVRDNGVGIAAENLARIFDPFFTTKDDVGTGIGLWITRDLVEKNGGHVSVHSDDLPAGFRTMFRVQFPLA
jgi:signal transduction histidine kinase